MTTTKTHHDFGWALHQMREGEKVRRPDYAPGVCFSIITDPEPGLPEGLVLHQGDKRYWRSGIDFTDISADDWELAP